MVPYLTKSIQHQVTKTNAFMHNSTNPATSPKQLAPPRRPTALETATFAATLLEDDPLFNSGRGAVFTRDGTNELEASVMVSRGRAKRAAAVAGLRRVRNPILLARGMLEQGDADLEEGVRSAAAFATTGGAGLDVPSARGHTMIFGEAAENLARMYGLEMVEPAYFFTQTRWDQHVRGLERERRGGSGSSWCAEEFLPQGTVGAVALDEDGVVCCATSTGGMTNKLTGRVGDTPVAGAGFWAEEWTEDGDPTGHAKARGDDGRIAVWDGIERLVRRAGPALALSEKLQGFVADCWPAPLAYAPVPVRPSAELGTTTTRSMAASATGNGDSFLRIAAVRTVAAMARFAGISGGAALAKVAGPSGELQRSAGDRWGRTGEGEGGMIGVECVVVRDGDGNCVEARSEIIQDFNCGGMFRAWIGSDGEPQVRIWRQE